MKKILFSLTLIHLFISLWACRFLGEMLHTKPPEVESCIMNTDHFLLRFSTSMEQNLTEQAFSLMEGENDLEGQFLWNDQSLSFYPFRGVIENRSYILNLNESAEDEYGNSLMKSESWVFNTGDDHIAPEILSVSPIDQSNLKDRRQIITFSFSESIDELSFLEALEIKPDLTFCLEWSENSRSVQIHPLEDFTPDQEYIIKLSSLLMDRAENTLEQEYKVNYETAERDDLVLQSLLFEKSNEEMHPSGINEGIEKDDNLYIKLNRRAENNEIYGFVRLKPETAFNLIWDIDYTACTLNFSENLQFGEIYELNILDQVYSFQCNGEQSIPLSIESVSFCAEAGLAAIQGLSLNNSLNAYDSNTAYLEFCLNHSPETEISQTSFMKAFSLESSVLSFKLLSLELERTESAGRTIIRVNLEITDTGFPGTVHFSMDNSLSDNHDNYLKNDWAMTVNQP